MSRARSETGLDFPEVELLVRRAKAALRLRRVCFDTDPRYRPHCEAPPHRRGEQWNKIKHRLFCHITQNWRGKPLRTFETDVEPIGNTRTAKGLRVKVKLDPREYKTGARITEAAMNELALSRHSFSGE